MCLSLIPDLFQTSWIASVFARCVPFFLVLPLCLHEVVRGFVYHVCVLAHCDMQGTQLRDTSYWSLWWILHLSVSQHVRILGDVFHQLRSCFVLCASSSMCLHNWYEFWLRVCTSWRCPSVSVPSICILIVWKAWLTLCSCGLPVSKKKQAAFCIHAQMFIHTVSLLHLCTLNCICICIYFVFSHTAVPLYFMNIDMNSPNNLKSCFLCHQGVL